MPITIYKGAIVTCDNENRVYRYLAEEDGRIRFVGDALPELYRAQSVTDLHEKALLPSFTDTHLHFSSDAFFNATLDVRNAKDFGDLKSQLQTYATRHRKRLIAGIGIAAQPIFLDWPEEPIPYLEKLLGDRVYAISPFKDMIRMGIPGAGGSDAPCTPPDPIAGIHAACNHYVPEQAVTIDQALKMFTSTAAWMSFDDKERGTLSAGRIADMVILSGNPLTTPTRQLNQLRVEKLILNGKPYQPGQNLLSLLFNCLLKLNRDEGHMH